MGEMIEIATLEGDDRFGAYRAEPTGAAKAAVVVIQEIFGVNPGIRAKVDDWAAKGYLAVAPDLFWRQAPGIELDPDQAEEREQGFALIGRLDLNAAMRDVEAVIRWARGQVDGGKVGLVGFCFGGRVAFLAATRTDVDVSVGYYGGGIDKLLGEAHAIARPLMLHFGDEDPHITPELVETIRAGLADLRDVTIHTYPGAGHGFATTFGQRRNAVAAVAADARTEALFAEALA